jgi:quercetin dioxygenase-like cupin family protein
MEHSPMTDQLTVVQIDELAGELLRDAQQQHSRRAAKTLATGSSLRATLIALAEGAELGEHDSPAGATIQAMSGRVRLHTRSNQWELEGGQLARTPAQRHGLTALTDAVVLLTVALR